VIVAHCRAKPDDMMPYSTLLPAFARDTIMSQAAELADQEEEALREPCTRRRRASDLHETDTPDGSRATVQFIEEFGRMTDIIKHHGRLADLDRDRQTQPGPEPRHQCIEIRLVPDRPAGSDVPALDRRSRSDFGKHVALGWNGSLEAARSVALTLDLIAAAERVTILAAGSGEPHGATAEELRTITACAASHADIHRFDARKPGAALLEKSRDLGAGMLVMGAYGHSHERETLFGGNTQTVVDQAEIPVIMAH
jgi:nucleotide-binding universal stress UspA family protein